MIGYEHKKNTTTISKNALLTQISRQLILCQGTDLYRGNGAGIQQLLAVVSGG
jgi:hypothetical protein